MSQIQKGGGKGVEMPSKMSYFFVPNRRKGRESKILGTFWKNQISLFGGKMIMKN